MLVLCKVMHDFQDKKVRTVLLDIGEMVYSDDCKSLFIDGTNDSYYCAMDETKAKGIILTAAETAPRKTIDLRSYGVFVMFYNDEADAMLWEQTLEANSHIADGGGVTLQDLARRD